LSSKSSEKPVIVQPKKEVKETKNARKRRLKAEEKAAASAKPTPVKTTKPEKK